VAETSGFATDLPQTAYLAHTIRRGISAAEQRSHRYVTLEHLLLALLDDPDALDLMAVARTDVNALRLATTETVNHNLATLYTPGTFDLHASYKVERVLQSASDDARRMGCTEVDGAFVAVALFLETDSAAYELLKRHNFVFHAANSWLDRNRGRRQQRYMPAPEPLEEEAAEVEAETEPEPDPEPVILSVPADDLELVEDDPEEEILLEEISDDEDGFDPPSPSGRPAESAKFPPYFQQQMQRGDASPVRQDPGAVLREALEKINEADDDDEAFLEPIIPSRHSPQPRTPQPEPTSSGPDLGTAIPAREPSLPAGRPFGGAAPPRPAEAAPAMPEWARPEPRPAPAVPPMVSDANRTEPRLPVGGDRGRGLGAAVPARAEPGRAEGHDLRPYLQPPGSATAQDLGLAVPARETNAPIRPAEPAESRQPRPHASARERSTSAPRPQQVPVSVGVDVAPAPNGMRGPGMAAERYAPPAPVSAGPRPEPSLSPAPRSEPSLASAPRPEPSLSPAARSEPSLSPAPRSEPSLSQAARAEPSLAPPAPRPEPTLAPPPPQPAPASAAPRPEPSLPPAARLDDMRVRPTPSGQPAPAPAPPGKAAKKSASRDSRDGEKVRTRRRLTPGMVYTGKLAENIPRKMKAFKPERIEVRITREETETFLAGMEGNAETVRHDLLVTQAMSVLLRAPDGGFTIETIAPETQWIFSRPGVAEKEPFGRWRWSVTPTETGPHRLQLVVSARSVDQSGLAGDTPLPDQVINVTVRANYGRNIMSALRWVVLMALGGAVTEGTLQIMRLLGK
jgi:hypothetical protein